MNKMLIVAGARPNFMKIAPLMSALKRQRKFSYKLIYTGQHYDFKMSNVFFQDLDISNPDIHLEIGSGTHAQQTAKIMMAFESIVESEDPSLVIVVGDVNSTLGCSL